MFPSEQVELPPPDKFKAFPEDAQKAILDAFKKEQAERHDWLKNQQGYDFRLNSQTEGHFFIWKMAGTVGAVMITLCLTIAGAWLVNNGRSAVGTASMFLAIGSLVGTAIYGHRMRAKPEHASPSSDKERSEAPLARQIES